METSALNLAHEKQRRAEALLRTGKFDESAKCHEEVTSLLSKAYTQLELHLADLCASTLSSQILPSPYISSAQTNISLESLALQRDYHKRQAALVRMKQVEYEEYKKTMEKQRKDFLNKQVPDENERSIAIELTSSKYDGSLRQAIYRTIEEQDSLLSMISLPDSEDKAFKHPKDPGTVIEELRTVNFQLRNLVGSLVSQLEAKEEEVRQLTEQLRAVSVSPNDEISSDEAHSLRLAPLPPLAPLEMPRFDFTSS